MYERYLELLNSTGVKSSDVAKATGIPPSTFSDWKRGKSSPKYEKLQKIANYFGVKADWLQGTSEYKTDDELYSKLAEDNMFIPTIEDVQAHYSASSMSKFGPDWKDKIKKGSLIPILGTSRAGIPNLKRCPKSTWIALNHLIQCAKSKEHILFNDFPIITNYLSKK